MDVKLKPVPAFYGVYLLRSCPPRHSSLYVGSTPNPALRLKQHNGGVQGGAVRTARKTLQPWDMLAVVEGFPSNIAALQFEWAWHNSHKTSHISAEDRFSMPISKSKVNKKTGKVRKKQGRPRATMMERIANLHLLLRTPYFYKMPLSLRCFNGVFHAAWEAWEGRQSIHIRPEIKVILDEKQPEDEAPSSGQKPAKLRKAELIGKGGPEGLDVTYAKFQPVLLKLQDIIDNSGRDHQCDICTKTIDMRSDLYNLCLNDSCKSLTHITCMSARFLKEASSSEILPRHGTCPSCKTSMVWQDLMRVLTLRTRADKQVTKVLKKRNKNPATIAAELLESDSNSEDEIHELSSSDSELSDTSTTRSISPTKTLPKKKAPAYKPSAKLPSTKPNSIESIAAKAASKPTTKKPIKPRITKTEISDSEDDRF